MNQQQLTVAKFAAILVVLIGGFVLVGVGKLDAATMYQQTTVMVGALVVALGISGAGSAAVAAAQTSARAKLAMFEAPDQVRRGATPGQAGFVRMLVPFAIVWTFALGLLVVGLARCTPGTPLPPIVSTGIDVGSCIMTTVAKDLAAGEGLPAAIDDAAVRCLGQLTAETRQKTSDLWSSHKAAELIERSDGGSP